MFGSKIILSKVEEAENHLQGARKALKLSILSLKFNPDYDIAAVEYNQAAQCFQAAGSDYTFRAIEAYMKVAEVREKQADAFGAGRAYEQAGNLYDQMKIGNEKLQQVIDLWTKAASYYKEAGKIDTTVRILQKIAKVYDEKIEDLEKCEALYKECLALYEHEEKFYYAADICKELIDILAKQKKFEALIEILDYYIKILLKINQNAGVHKALLSKIVIFLTIQDIVAAENCLFGSGASVTDGSFLASREFQVGCDAVDAYKCGDMEKFREIMKSQIWTFLQIEIVKLVRQLGIAQVNKESSILRSSSEKEPCEDEIGKDVYDYSNTKTETVNDENLSKKKLYDDLLC